MIVIANVFPKLQTVKSSVRKLSQEHRFRTGFGSQYVKDSQMLPQIPWERFYHVFSSLSVKLIWKISPLVLAEILEEFVNELTAYGKYPVQGFENLQLPIQMQLSQKWKTFSEFYVPFQNYRLWKSLLETSLKSTVSEQASGVNMWKRWKCLLNFHKSDFIMFFCHSQVSWLGKRLS